MTSGIRGSVSDILTAEAAALEHYILGLESGLPRSDIILAMKIHIQMLRLRAELIKAEETP